MSRAADLAALIVDVNTTEAKTDELTGKTTAGSIAVTGEGGSTTTNLQQGLAKMWSSTNSAGTSINDSLNVSSLTDTATGQQTLNFSNSFDNASNYSCSGSLDSAGGYHLALATSFTSKFTTFAFTTAYIDQAIKTSAHGDLA